MLRSILAALTLTACASAPHEDHSRVGRLYHYVRSNQDGSEPEHIYQFHASETRLEVGKMVSNCTNAAFVTADLDPVSHQARALVGGRLGHDLSQAPFAWLSYDRQSGRLQASVPAAQIDANVTVAGEPWMLFDFDLADLNAMHAGHPVTEENFRFAVALIWTEEGAPSPLRNLGWAEARLVDTAVHLGRPAAHFHVRGALNGELWLDAQEGHVLEARFSEPNHAEYQDFRLVLHSVEDDGAESWRAARAAHWEGC